MQEKIYLPVNWTDGMKINKHHFRAEQQACNWQLAMDSRAWLNEYNYGLFLQTGAPGAGRPVVQTTDNQQQVSVRLLSCQALTPGGHLVFFGEESLLPGGSDNYFKGAVTGLQIPYAQLAASNADYYVVLAVDPYNRQPVGEPDTGESQLRAPFTAPAYSLQLVSHQEMPAGRPSAFYLPVGKIKVRDGKVLSDEEYIPPCTCTAAHPALVELHATLEHFFSSMEVHVLRIQQKIIQKRQQNNLATVIMELCDKMTVYMSGEYQRILQEYKYQPPVHMFRAVAGLARLMKNSLDIYAGTVKDELLAYFSEWCAVTQGELESAAVSLCNHRYSHIEIREAARQVLQFTGLVLPLFDSLAALEYIGKKKEAGIFVKEHLVVPGEEAPVVRRRSFLAE
jgi:hypothetical protein